MTSYSNKAFSRCALIRNLTLTGDAGMLGTDGGGGTLDRGHPGKLIPDRKASSCVLGDEGTTTTKRANIKLISSVLSLHKRGQA